MSIIILNATMQCRISIKFPCPMMPQKIAVNKCHTDLEIVVLIKYPFPLDSDDNFRHFLN